MKAVEWINKVKLAKGWESDYRVAKELGLSRNLVSTYRAGRAQTMDEDTAEKVAQALGISPVAVIIDQVAERSKKPALSSALQKVAATLYIMLNNFETGVSSPKSLPALIF